MAQRNSLHYARTLTWEMQGVISASAKDYGPLWCYKGAQVRKRSRRRHGDILAQGPSTLFHQYSSGRGDIDALLTAALGPELTSPTAAFTYRQGEVRVTDTGWAARQSSQSRAKPVRDPQADSKTSSELSHRYSKLPAARHGSAADLATSTSIARNLKHNTHRLPDKKMEQ